jgi:multidrug efflux pump subunit AcrA (membrane-fusion protein)
MPIPFINGSNPLLAFWQQHKDGAAARPLLVIIITLALILLFRFLQPLPPVKEKQEKSWMVQTVVLQNGSKSPQLALYGKVESPYTSTLTASVTANVAALEAREGDRVTAEQPLIQLDDQEVRLLAEQRRADVADLEAQIEAEQVRHKNDLAALKLEKSLVALAEKKLAREEKTSKANLTSQSSYDTQKQALQSQQLALKARQLNVDNHASRLAQLQAKLEQKKALAAQAEIDLARTSISAPFDGIILKTHVAPGERVRPGEAMIELYSTANIELRAQLPHKYVDQVRQALTGNAALNATVSTASGPLSAQLRRVSGSVTSTGKGVDALFSVSGQDADRLIIGEVMDIRLDLPPVQNAYRVPVSALYGTDRIYRVKDNRLQTITVEKLGYQRYQNEDFLLVRSDRLNVGDEIITTQLPHAVSGLKVEIRNRPDDAAAMSAPLN